ncbi:MAG TPA: cyclodeaminase/cyclohydrolase family protein [Solirubrobacteraceae bacterium]|jgi:formiminotetrahydrofolate cyclodeaminase|nr:cyclodeaminase/cyclohydrolase family protein [Solirubrobacteraceae bacterium]
MSGPSVIDELSALPLGEVLERVAAPTPAPGGGSAAALVCAMAAALVEMAAGFSDAPDAADRRGRAAQLRSRGLELAQRDQLSYEPVLRALRRPADDVDRPGQLAAALAAAAGVPLAIAQLAAEIAGRAREAVEGAGRHVLGDCATAAVLAEAGCRAAALLVEINLHGTMDPRRAEAEQLAGAAIVDSQHVVAKAHES